MFRWFVGAFCVGFLFALAPACGGAPPKCGVATCSGCCDSNGTCQPGFHLSACGANGNSCIMCTTTQLCSAGFCTGAGGGGGGTGGTGGGGGGAGGGGGTGGGGGGSSCGPSNCSGCCDSFGVCRTGTQSSTCGKAGGACVVCETNQTCSAGTCVTNSSVKRVFVTVTDYDGNLKGKVSGAASGLAAGDKLCQLAADAAVLGGTWKAWLSDGSTNTNAIDRIADVGPWYLVDGTTKVFNNKANLATSPLQVINRNENGGLVSADVWTGTSAGGTASDSCNGWATINSGSGRYGNSTSTANWTDYSYDSCYEKKHLYCFEQ